MNYCHFNKLVLHEYPREKILDPRNTHKETFWTHKVPTIKTFGPTKYPRKNFPTHEVLMREKFGPTKYPREKISDPRSSQEKRRHDGTIAQDLCGPRWHATHGIQQILHIHNKNFLDV